MLEFLTLKPEAFGIDISDFSLKIIKLKRRAGEFDLACFGEEQIPEGVFQETEIKDEKTLSKLIRQAVGKIKGEKIGSKAVIASLPEEKSFLKLIQLPKMSAGELAKAVPIEAENYIPIPLSESYFDFEVVPSSAENLDHIDVLLAVIPRTVVNSYHRVLKQAGLEPLALEIESLSTSRALIKNGFSDSPVLLIDFGATRTGLIIFSGTSVRVVASLDISSRKLTEALAQGLSIGFGEAERIKIDYGLELKAKAKLREKTGDLELEKEIMEDEKIPRLLNPILMDLVGQIKNHLDFYYSHISHEHLSSGKREVKKALLAGGGANLKGLDKFLSRELGITVELGNPWINVLADPQEVIPEKYLRKSLAFTNALGLALRGVMAAD